MGIVKIKFRDLNRQYDALKSEIDSRMAKVISAADYISGAEVHELEECLEGYVGVKNCISCGNGTDAITISLIANGIGPGDAVFVPDFTFFSSGECPGMVGAVPVFVDVCWDTYNIDPSCLSDSVEKVMREGKYKPRAVLAVDLFGLPADYPDVRMICEKYNLILIEDGAQGFGGRIGKKMACSFGDVSTTSFFPAKPLGCYGDGGAIFTDNDDLAVLCRSIAVHGKNMNNKYDNVRLGMNSRLDTIQASVLLAKFPHFRDKELERVDRISRQFTEMLAAVDGLGLPVIPDGYVSSWAQYTLRLPDDTDREKVIGTLKELGIPTNIYYYKPMHKQIAFSGTYSEETSCPVTEELCKKVISLPLHPYLTDEETGYIAESVISAIRGI